jgi:hypothetical protein
MFLILDFLFKNLLLSSVFAPRCKLSRSEDAHLRIVSLLLRARVGKAEAVKEERKHKEAKNKSLRFLKI